MKKIFLIIVSAFILNTLTLAASANEVANIEINGKPIHFNVSAETINGRIFVDSKGIYEAFDAKVTWDESNKTFSAIKDNTVISIAVNDNKIKVNDEYLRMDVNCYLENENLMLPIRFAANSLNYPVVWIENKNTVSITTPDYYDDIKIEHYFSDISYSDNTISGFDITDMTLASSTYNSQNELLASFNINGRTFGDTKLLRFYLEFFDSNGIFIAKKDITKLIGADATYSAKLITTIPEGTKSIKFKPFNEYVVTIIE